jgi:D-alanine-D-alanine ligase
MRIGVVMGGVSSEREVSLETGKGMLDKLSKEKYSVVPVLIDDKKDIIEKAKDIDFALIALHGKYGEDGAIQGIFEALNLPYSGCGGLSSALCMNKTLTKKIMKAEGLNTPDSITLSKSSKINIEVVNKMGYPLVIKPNSGGSSIGIFIVRSEIELCEIICKALKFDNEVIIEKYLEGEEYTVCILNGIVLPIMLIKPSNIFFDYSSKYDDNGAFETVATLSEGLKTKVQEMSLKCWDSFYCKVYARIDIIVSEGIPYLLEINTLPGMTRNSVFPKSAKATGIDYSELLDLIIKYSLIERGSSI